MGVDFDSETLNKIYEGEFKEDFYNGRGIYYNISGFKEYSGYFKRNRYNGYGILFFQDGHNIKLEGEFINDELDGMGIEYNDRECIIFKGKFKKGKRKGFGKQFFAVNIDYANQQYNEIVIYEGEFSDNCKNGIVTKFDILGEKILKGFWKNDKLVEILLDDNKIDNQKQVIKFANETYVGQSLNNQPHGHGIMYLNFMALKIYEGDFFKGNQNGYGKEYYLINPYCPMISYIGKFLKNKRSDYGVSYHPNGKVNCVGKWIDNLVHGFNVNYDQYGCIAHINQNYFLM